MKLTKTTAAALGVVLTLSLAGCAADSPFDQEGEGTLRLRMVVNSEVTRAAMDRHWQIPAGYTSPMPKASFTNITVWRICPPRCP